MKDRTSIFRMKSTPRPARNILLDTASLANPATQIVHDNKEKEPCGRTSRAIGTRSTPGRGVVDTTTNYFRLTGQTTAHGYYAAMEYVDRG
jgi:hypothetical protein